MTSRSAPHARRYLAWIALPLLSLACSLTGPISFIPGTGQGTPAPAALRPSPSVGPTPTLVAVPAPVTDEETLRVNLYARVNPSVVNVSIFGQQAGDVLPLGTGSGFVFDAEGHIVTNAHVVEGADEVEVRFADGTVREARVVGEDLNSDLAVIQVDELPAGANPLPLGNLDEVRVGQTVMAIGNPFGLEGTLTLGIVSALGRSIPALTAFDIPQAIQTDAAINPGNSGGPLLDLQGRVIGVNAQIETGGQSRTNSGVGFAIPVSIVSRVVPALIRDGAYHWPWLGVSGASLTARMVEAARLPVASGAYLSEVAPGGPADQAGLRGSTEVVAVDGRQVEVGGDLVVAIDSQPVRTFEDLLVFIALEATPGQEVTLSILRDGQPVEARVRLGTRPDTLDQQLPPGHP